jgi:hypothetical protein
MIIFLFWKKRQYTTEERERESDDDFSFFSLLLFSDWLSKLGIVAYLEYK